MKILRSRLGLTSAWLAAGLAALLVQSAPVHAGEALTLDAALTRAAQRPQLALSQQDIDAANDSLSVAGTPLYNPIVSVEAGPQFGEIPLSPLLNLGIDQTIERGGKRGARQRAAQGVRQLAVAVRSDAVRSARLGAWRAFELALISKQRIAVLVQVEQLATAVLDATRRAQAAGGATTLRLNLLLAEHGRAVQQRAAANLEYQHALADLATEIGAAPDAELDPIGEMFTRLAVPTPAAAAQTHSALTIATANMDLAAREQQVANADAVPDFTIGLGYSYQATPDIQHGVFARLSIPLAFRNHNERARAMARSESRKATVVRDLVATDLARRSQVARRNVAIADAAVAAFDEAITNKLTENLALAQDAFTRGAIDFIELTLTQRDLIAARLAYLDAHVLRINAWAELLDATGMDVQP
ncbi:MAG TPA: TolC family protein [Kofleriaceae bacterium]|nr:TolC family protein [Kofleriaceae bacterium]